jgi:hypothetical protein
MNKKLLIGLGVVAAAGVGYYLWKRNKDSKNTEIPAEKREGEVKLSDALPKKVANTPITLTKKPLVEEGALIKTARPTGA